MNEAQKRAILQKIKELKDLRIFYNMTERDIFEVMKLCEIEKYSKDDVVFSEGDQDDTLYVIVDGNFEVVSTGKKSDEQITFFFAGEGLIFGEMSFLDSKPRSATIVAREDSEVFKIARTKFDHLLANDPVTAAKFMMGVSEILSRRLRGANSRIKHST